MVSGNWFLFFCLLGTINTSVKIPVGLWRGRVGMSEPAPQQGNHAVAPSARAAPLEPYYMSMTERRRARAGRLARLTASETARARGAAIVRGALIRLSTHASPRTRANLLHLARQLLVL